MADDLKSILATVARSAGKKRFPFAYGTGKRKDGKGDGALVVATKKIKKDQLTKECDCTQFYDGYCWGSEDGTIFFGGKKKLGQAVVAKIALTAKKLTGKQYDFASPTPEQEAAGATLATDEPESEGGEGEGEAEEKKAPKTTAETPDPKKAPKPDAKTEPKAETKAEPKPQPKSETKAEPKPEPKAQPKTEPKPGPKVEAKAQDEAAEYKEKLAEYTPVIKKAIAAKVPAAADISRALAQATAQSKPGGNIKNALKLLTEAHTLAQSADDVLEFKKRLAEWTPAIKEAMAAKGPNAGEIARTLAQANAQAKPGGDIKNALALLTEARDLAKAEAEAEPEELSIEEIRKRARQERKLWVNIRDRLEAAEWEMEHRLEGKIPPNVYQAMASIGNAARNEAYADNYPKAFEYLKNLEKKVDAAWIEHGDQKEIKRVLEQGLRAERNRLAKAGKKVHPEKRKQLESLVKAMEKFVADGKWKEARAAQTELNTSLTEIIRNPPPDEEIVDRRGDTDEVKEWKAAQRENANKAKSVTAKVKDLARRTARLKDSRAQPLKKVVAALNRGVLRKDWDRLEPAIAKLEPIIAKAELFQKKADEEAAKKKAEGGEQEGAEGEGEGGDKKAQSEQDKKQRAEFVAEIRQLAKRAVQLPSEGNRELRNSVSGLFQLLSTAKWDDIRAKLDDKTREIEKAESEAKA